MAGIPEEYRDRSPFRQPGEVRVMFKILPERAQGVR
jgi:hypothetical protein